MEQYKVMEEVDYGGRSKYYIKEKCYLFFWRYLRGRLNNKKMSFGSMESVDIYLQDLVERKYAIEQEKIKRRVVVKKVSI